MGWILKHDVSNGWKNGETLPGKVADWDHSNIHFKHPLSMGKLLAYYIWHKGVKLELGRNRWKFYWNMLIQCGKKRIG